jgi:hypothetical protein
MCFVHAWNTELEAKNIALQLSRQRSGVGIEMLSSRNKLFNQTISAVAVVRPWYSASVLEHAIVACFLGVCLDRAKNNARIEELRIISEDSEKIVIF